MNRWVWVSAFCCALPLAACGDDDGGDDPGDAGTDAATGSAGTAGGAARGGGGRGGASGSGGRGQPPAAGRDAGSSGDSGAAPDAGTDAGTDSGTDAGTDSGTDGGEPQPVATVCKAPVAAVDPGNDCPSGDPVALELVPVRSGLSVPVLVTHAPDDPSRLFVVERNGMILILDPDGDPISEFLDLQDAVTTVPTDVNDERGLLGMAFHPDYPRDPRFFVSYTVNGVGGLKDVVSSFEVSAADPDVADPESEQELIRIDDFATNHNGGMLAFGQDGCLFFGTGDGGAGDDPQANGQNLNTALGKILRFDVDNPTVAAPGNFPGGNPHIWDYGLRNPWRFSFDRDTGDLYIGDVGQGTLEEIDVEPKGTGHKNYGWKIAEGTQCRPGESGCDQTDLDMLDPPVEAYPRADGDCVVGGYVYRGSEIESLQGWYVYGDNGSRKIRAFVWDGEQRCGDRTLVLTERDTLSTNDADITSFGEDESGELYVTTSNSVFRIRAKN